MDNKLQPHSFYIEDAQKYGVEGAVILYNMKFWLTKNKANKSHINKLGDKTYYWTFNSVKAFSELFPYMSKSQITRTIKKLEESGELISGEFNKKNYDRTKWYTTSQFEILELTKMTNGVNENDKPIPDINTDINTDTFTTKVVEEEKPFIFDEYLETMKKDNNKAIRLIALFFIEKKLKFNSNAEVRLAIKRHIKEANVLSKIYDFKKIIEAISWCKKEHANIWTMETITKYLTTHMVNK